MRPSAAIVETANRSESTVMISLNGRSANARSILDLFGLAAEDGSELTLEADGPDASAVLDAISTILTTPPCDD
jgi:phosphotransferase system HPr (HPr) family protein